MPIETTCTGCGRQLRVAEEHVGKQARCPVCNTIYTVVANEADEDSVEIPVESVSPLADDQAAANAWWMRTPEGQTYGPVSREEMDRWVGEGRVSSNCDLRAGKDGPWQAADALFPGMAPDTGQYAPTSPFQTASPQPSSQTAPATVSYSVPHRGGIVLSLGILSWVFFFCLVFGIAAWLMGNNDLNEMRNSRMDASGMGMTQAGQILGMISVVLWLVCMVILIFGLVMAAAL